MGRRRRLDPSAHGTRRNPPQPPEVTSGYAEAYAKASKKDRGRVLDQVVAVTGWSRDNARRRLVAAARGQPGGGRQVAKRPRKQRSPKFSYDALKVLQRVWAASGGQCGKYLAASMRTQLDLLERHGELAFGVDRYSPAVRAELLEAELVAYRDRLNPAQLAREIADLQSRLLVLAKDKTEQLYLASVPTALPDVRNGIRIKAS